VISMAQLPVVRVIATLLSALVVYAQARKVELPPLTASGVVMLYAQGTLMLVLDRVGPEQQPVGTTLTFLVDNTTRIQDRDRPANAAAIQPEIQAQVSYSDTPRGLLAREIRLMGKARTPAEETVPKRIPPATKGSDPAASKNRGPSGKRGPSKQPTVYNLPARAVLNEVRLQSTNRPGAPAIGQVHSGVPFYIAFYSRVDASSGPVTLTYQCLKPDFSTGGLKPMPECNAEETIPAGSQGAKFRAFQLTYRLEKGLNKDQSVIAAEMAPVIYISKDNELRKFQRKLVELTILP
jgi:hypothetical protein